MKISITKNAVVKEERLLKINEHEIPLGWLLNFFSGLLFLFMVYAIGMNDINEIYKFSLYAAGHGCTLKGSAGEITWDCSKVRINAYTGETEPTGVDVYGQIYAPINATHNSSIVP